MKDWISFILDCVASVIVAVAILALLVVIAVFYGGLLFMAGKIFYILFGVKFFYLLGAIALTIWAFWRLDIQ